ncbi:MAG: HPr(Ser) kinase/phosphatase [Myxococcales bacterium]|nr:HPr(Ser) kinase/phosphatase [Myxococcales bacterium]
MSSVTVGDLYAQKSETLQLDLVFEGGRLDREITLPDASSPGLVLAGFTDRFMSKRMHVLGETEVEYLRSLTAQDRLDAFRPLLNDSVPCIFITKGQDLPAELVDLAKERGVALIRSQLRTSEFYRRLTPYLTEMFAPTTTIHGSLADVFGVGLLFVGRSGIGKSECVLDLVERGHRLVADDVVHVTRRGGDVLLGRANEMAHRYMEIRGVGIVDIQALFGIRAVRQQKRIEVVVQLQDWESASGVDRTGLDTDTTSILDVEIPTVVVLLNPGKNITVISEVVAMAHLLRYSGVDAARDFNKALIAKMAGRRQLREYLSEDYE